MAEIEAVTLAQYVERIPALDPGTSIGFAAERLRESRAPFVALCRYGLPVGIVGEPELAGALAAGRTANDPVGSIANLEFPRLSICTTTAAAAEDAGFTQRGAAVVVGPSGEYVGLVMAADLIARHPLPIRPRIIGGMATPFGVYLTTGYATAGKEGWALVATGALLMLFYLAANLATFGLGTIVEAFSDLEVLQVFSGAKASSNEPGLRFFGQAAVALFFLTMLRLSPLSAIHGAEHKTVHAIERQERLSLEVVRRMPCVHIRCGTNIAAAAVLFLTLAGIGYSQDWRSVGLLLALLAVVALWRPLGYGLQRFATTREPTDKQLLQAIEAGEELLAKARKSGDPIAPLYMRISRSGLPQVVAGALLCGAAVELLERALRVSLPILL